VLEVFAPGLFLLFVDILFGNVIYACGRGTGFAIGKVASVAVGTALNLLLIPFFQGRYGNGGIGVVVSFALSEFVVFAGAVFVLRAALTASTVLDVVRALAAAAATVLLFRAAPAMPAWAGIPLCVGAFAAASFAFGLMRRNDVVVLRGLLRR